MGFVDKDVGGGVCVCVGVREAVFMNSVAVCGVLCACVDVCATIAHLCLCVCVCSCVCMFFFFLD